MKKSLPPIPSIALLLALLALSGCLGPKPVLRGYEVEPPAAGSDQPYKIDATIANEGPGAGQVEVEVNMSNKQTGEFLAKENKEVEMQMDEIVHVLIEIDLPPSAQDLNPDNIKVEVDAHYPIE